MNYCKECNTKIDKRSNRCNRCAKLQKFRTKSSLLKMKHFMTGIRNPKWNKGRRIHTSGYVMLNTKYFPCNSKKLYVFEHRYIIEMHLGRKLTKKEIVHHIDGNKKNNKLNNLYVFPTNICHTGFEMLVKYNIVDRFSLKSNLNHLKCDNNFEVKE